MARITFRPGTTPEANGAGAGVVPDRFLGGPAGQGFGLAIPVDDGSLQVDADEGILGRLDDGADARFAGLHRLQRPPQLARAGVDQFLFAGADAVATLKGLQERLGVRS